MTNKEINLFEVSWEVCNKVGGIYTVLATKAPYAVEKYKNKYTLIGPDLYNSEFIECYDKNWSAIKNQLLNIDIYCRFGYWDIKSKPQVILIDYRKTKKGYEMLDNLLKEYNINLNDEKWNGIEAAIFGMLSGIVINELSKNVLFSSNEFCISHFHEWMCGTGILLLKKANSNIATVFTTHATSIGRYLSKIGINIFNNTYQINADLEAHKHKIFTKHIIEKQTAQHTDVFTTVSETTAMEASVLWDRYPDYITHNGLNISNINKYPLTSSSRESQKKEIIGNINKKLNWDLSNETKIIFYSSRSEFRNKGLDVLLQALNNLEQFTSKQEMSVLFVCVILNQKSDTACIIPPCVEISREHLNYSIDLITKEYNLQTNQFLLKTLKELSIDNKGKVKYLFIPTFLDGNDGIINKDYWSFLPLCDMGVYPSLYEPWGYTPHETALLGVPTITTDLSGFGQWVKLMDNDSNGIFVTKRNLLTDEIFIKNLETDIKTILSDNGENLNIMRINAHNIALNCSWINSYKNYIECYKVATEKSYINTNK